jgi:hypothetical protein
MSVRFVQRPPGKYDDSLGASTLAESTAATISNAASGAETMRTWIQVSRPLLTADPALQVADVPRRKSTSQREDKDQQLQQQQQRRRRRPQQQKRIDMYRREPYQQTDRSFYMTLRQKPVR